MGVPEEHHVGWGACHGIPSAQTGRIRDLVAQAAKHRVDLAIIEQELVELRVEDRDAKHRALFGSLDQQDVNEVLAQEDDPPMPTHDEFGFLYSPKQGAGW